MLAGETCGISPAEVWHSGKLRCGIGSIGSVAFRKHEKEDTEMKRSNAPPLMLI